MRGVIYLQACTLMHNINMFHMLEDINRAEDSVVVEQGSTIGKQACRGTFMHNIHMLPPFLAAKWALTEASHKLMKLADMKEEHSSDVFERQIDDWRCTTVQSTTKEPYRNEEAFGSGIVHDELSKGFQLVAEPMLSLRGE